MFQYLINFEHLLISNSNILAKFARNRLMTSKPFNRNMISANAKSRVLSLIMKAVLPVALVSSCSSTKFVGDNQYLLKSNVITCGDKKIDTKVLEAYNTQHPNSKWFSLFKIPLSIYSMSGRDSTKWINRTLRRIGERPVVFDSLKTQQSCANMTAALKSMGYLQASVSCSVTKKRNKATCHYIATPGQKYTIDSVAYIIEDESLVNILKTSNLDMRGLKRGMDFSNANLDAERKRITQNLLDSGFYLFNKDFIHYVVDTLGKDGKVDIELHLIKYRASNNSPEIPHKRFFINKVSYSNGGGNSARIPLRKHVLENNTFIQEGKAFSATDVQNTYNNFARLQAVRYTNVHFEEHPDTSLLDCDIQVSTRKPNSISFQPEGTNTAGDFGAAASLTYTNNNLFRGSEVFSVQLRGAFEAITGLEGYQNEDYEEYSIETRLAFPRLIAPFFANALGRRNRMKSELLFSYNLQNRPEFHRRVLTGSWRYHWSVGRRKNFRLDFVDVNYVQMPWISSKFKEEYLDNASNRNAILRYNYEDLFILRTGLNFTYSDSKNSVRSNIEIGGNLLNAISHIAGTKRNSNGQYTLFKIAYAQYVKGDFDYTHLVRIDSKNTLALHFGLGIAYPYGNSNILPFEKRYFSGGANSVRGWNVRGLGPGKFKGTDGRIDFINQTGDMKLDINMELRTFLFWKFNGAFFIDAGNIWTLRDYKEQDGGQFKFSEFYKQMAVAYGLGIRMNLDYFIMRLDFGMKAINPAYDSKKEHFPIIYPNMGRDLAVHFAVGLPF